MGRIAGRPASWVRILGPPKNLLWFGWPPALRMVCANTPERRRLAQRWGKGEVGLDGAQGVGYYYNTMFLSWCQDRMYLVTGTTHSAFIVVSNIGNSRNVPVLTQVSSVLTLCSWVILGLLS